MDFLQKLKSLFSGFGSGNDSVLGIDIGMSTVKLVQIRKQQGRAILETYGEVAVGPYAGKPIGDVAKLNQNAMSQLLQDLLREVNATTNQAGVSVPFTSSFAVVIKLPDLPEKEINALVPNEARKYIPLKIEEVMLDWMILPKRKDAFEEARQIYSAEKQAPSKPTQSYKEVLLVAIHNSTVADLQQIMKSANIKPLFYELESFSIMRSSIGPSIYSIGIVDFGASGTKVYVVRDGALRLSHIINYTTQQITRNISNILQVDFKTAENLKKEIGLKRDVKLSLVPQENINAVVDAQEVAFSRIFSEINKVFIEYEKKYKSDIERVYFTGGGALTKGLVEFAKQKLPSEIVYADPFSLLAYPDFLDDVVKRIGPEFAISIGLAMRALEGR